ncbi:MAG TPA: CDP-archaeol synthase [Kofleriaceae bacterium]
METWLWAAARALWLLAPILLSAAAHGFVLRFDLMRPLKQPMDFGLSLGGVRLFGDNKTWRAFVVAVIAGAVGTTLQRAIADELPARLISDHGALAAPVLGALIGAGAILGELPNSFIKRRARIAPGSTAGGPLGAGFYLLDQIDLVIVTWPLIWPFVDADWRMVVASMVLAATLHPLVSLIGYLGGARKTAR